MMKNRRRSKVINTDPGVTRLGVVTDPHWLQSIGCGIVVLSDFPSVIRTA
jgi:hypothetical protein